MTGYEKMRRFKGFKSDVSRRRVVYFNRTGSFVPVQMNALSIKAPIR